MLLLTGVAFVAGLVDSVAGGGGLLTVPSFLLSGLPPQTALGTNKFMTTLGTAAATGNFLRHGKINFKVLLAGIVPALVGAFLGSKIVLLLTSQTVGKIILLILPFAALATFAPKKAERGAESRNQFSRKDLAIKVPLICGVVGFYDGFFGPATGTFLTLGFFTFLHMPLLQSAANARIFNFLSNFSALLGFMLAGKVQYFFALPMVVANVAGNFLGSKLALAKGEKFIKAFLALSLTGLFASLLWRLF